MSDAPPPEGHTLIGDYVAALERAKAERKPDSWAREQANRWSEARRRRARKAAA